jgi:uncharacterized protein YpuA (DUF1002 family)
MRHLKVQGNSSLVRDIDSQALINIDDNAFNSYMRTKENYDKKENEFEQLRTELAEIKRMMTNLLSRGDLWQQ